MKIKEIIKYNKKLGIIVLLTILVMLVGSIKKIIWDPVGTIGAFLGIAAVMIVVYLIAGNEVVLKLKRKGKIKGK